MKPILITLLVVLFASCIVEPHCKCDGFSIIWPEGVAEPNVRLLYPSGAGYPDSNWTLFLVGMTRPIFHQGCFTEVVCKSGGFWVEFEDQTFENVIRLEPNRYEPGVWSVTVEGVERPVMWRGTIRQVTIDAPNPQPVPAPTKDTLFESKPYYNEHP